MALVGVAVLIGLAITDNDEPETLTEAESTLVDPAATTATTGSATTLASDVSSESTASDDSTDPTTACDRRHDRGRRHPAH